MRKDTSKMDKVEGFETLYVDTYKTKFYIYCPYYETTIGPAFQSLEDLKEYAEEHYRGSYV